MRTLIKYQLIIVTFCVGVAGCQATNPDATSRQTRGINRGPDIDPDELLDPLGARSSNRLLLEDLSPGQIGTTLATRVRGGSNEQKANQLFQSGNSLYQQALAELDANPTGNAHKANFEKAANHFRVAAANFPDSALEQDSLFFEGESYFFADRYVQSNRAFEKLIASYAGTRYLDQAESRRFAIAQYWLDQVRAHGDSWVPNIAFNDPSRPTANMKTEARRILHRIRVDDPTGKLSDDATMALGNAYFEDEQYYDAGDTYEDLRNNYPGSKHAFHATLFELKSRMQSYYGQSYDQQPIQKAEKLLEILVNQYPQQAQEEEEYLAREAGTIRDLLAKREFSLGEYYEKRGQNRAAALMYQLVAQKYDDTRYADQVQTRIASIADKPLVPEQKAKWLVDLLSVPEQKPLVASGDSGSTLR